MKEKVIKGSEVHNGKYRISSKNYFQLDKWSYIYIYICNVEYGIELVKFSVIML